MNAKYRFLFLLVIIIILWKSFSYYDLFSTKEEVDPKVLAEKVGKIKVSVYYEALCPDSKYFIAYQLSPVYEELKEYIILDLVPYGKATTVESNGKYMFFCQHDAVECFANKIHACVIDIVQNPLQQLKYVACMITDNMIPDDAGEKCGQELKIDYNPIRECSVSDHGSNLLKHFGDRTNSLSPRITFIPTIEINNNQSKIPQSAILKDVKKSLCKSFATPPKECGSW